MKTPLPEATNSRARARATVRRAKARRVRAVARRRARARASGWRASMRNSSAQFPPGSSPYAPSAGTLDLSADRPAIRCALCRQMVEMRPPWRGVERRRCRTGGPTDLRKRRAPRRDRRSGQAGLGRRGLPRARVDALTQPRSRLCSRHATAARRRVSATSKQAVHPPAGTRACAPRRCQRVRANPPRQVCRPSAVRHRVGRTTPATGGRTRRALAVRWCRERCEAASDTRP